MLNSEIQGVKFDKLPNSSLDCIKISNKFCDALVSFQGAQVLEFTLKKFKKPILWLSKLNKFQAQTPIRGGIPLCFPWFGSHKMLSNHPSHGFARTQLWNLANITVNEFGHKIVFELTDNALTHTYWDYSFKLIMTINCGEKLELTLHIENLDKNNFDFDFAWHSYFPVNNIKQASLIGLYQMEYIDQLSSHNLKKQNEKIVVFQEEIDRIYPSTTGCFILMQDNTNKIYIESTARSVIVWNPWITKTKLLKDLENNSWQNFVCVESGQVNFQTVTLQSNHSIVFKLLIS